ncbi:type I-B CRISPR-associated protein Cas8b1/Cst1 [Thermocrinis minervae]|uniref:CRISPR-associated protein Cst1 n=1 Tax=Thermocrinis minervae TaxID=381751 RepID=A0A1M6Q5C0_9AQUI|nr:type I-B CRISPR-associated protein Cas8b1/Cst1 [Thermocrinis minervae]SHK15454.1 CRISPR-associated protein Cst1 [Thermocrinis minervae]
MGIVFYVNDWLTAAAGVGLLRVLENVKNSVPIEGNRIDVPEDVFERLADYYAEYLLKDITVEKLKDIIEKERQKKKESTINVYNTLVLSKLKSFYSNSPLANPSSASKAQEVQIEISQDTEKLYKDAKQAIANFIKKQFDTIRSYKTSDKTCFFCGERKAYIKNKEVKVFDATNFTPLSASPKTVENFFYNGRSNQYLCPECEIFLYFSIFGFLPTGNKKYTFVYMPDLKKTYDMNTILKGEKGISTKYLKMLFTEYLKELEGRKIEWTLKNIYIVEIELVGNAKANIHSFSIPPKVAIVLNERIDSYPKFLESVLGFFLDYIYSERSLYEFLLKLLSGFFHKNTYTKVNVQTLEKVGAGLKSTAGLIYFVKFQESLNNDGKNLDEPIEKVYKEGKSLGKSYDKEKLNAISLNLFEAVRMRNVDLFYQTLIRAYIDIDKEIPKVLIHGLTEEGFNWTAYSFLIGLGAVTDEGRGTS